LHLRTQEVDTARESGTRASIQLARLLRLDPFVQLQPADKQAMPVTLMDADTPPTELAALALGSRPELTESQAFVRLAQERLRQATYGPLLPSVLLDYRAGGFGGGRGEFFGNFDGRSDFDAAMVWELKNLGFGDRAVHRLRQSEVRQAQLRGVEEMDRIVSEVAEALARVKSRQTQIESARAAQTSAANSYKLNLQIYTEEGIPLIRPIEVMQSLQALARARQDYLATIVDYNRAQFQLYWALGNPIPEANSE
jgi:outer membrane protein TolC